MAGNCGKDVCRVGDAANERVLGQQTLKRKNVESSIILIAGAPE